MSSWCPRRRKRQMHRPGSFLAKPFKTWMLNRKQQNGIPQRIRS